ncbi:ThiF family adenylyltransferase [Paractinoplanes rhizophilus]|uniref:ThiF family adenylyltransferase n=1 Tax=Paractinoplanes rhizophilus TaxID=1416877 RepID=A0ABW2HYF0_9ACTN
MIGPLLLLPRDAARHLEAAGAGRHGVIRFRHSSSDKSAVVSFVHNGSAGYQVSLRPKHHPMNCATPGGDGLWCKVPADLHLAWYDIARRHATMTTLDAFKGMLPITLKDPGNTGYVVLTYAPEAAAAPYNEVPIPVFAAWFVTRQGAEPARVAVEPETTGIDQIRPFWPVEDLSKVTVTVIGVGSIGGAAARSLAGYGVGRLRLLDPDRLMWHNLVRHVLPDLYVGQYKVDGMREFLGERHPDTSIEAHHLDVVDQADRNLSSQIETVCASVVGWLIQAFSGSWGARGRRVNRSGCCA